MNDVGKRRRRRVRRRHRLARQFCIWARVPGFLNYMVSSRGEVYAFRGKRILKDGGDKGWYKQVFLSKGGKVYTKFVHRLVAEAFIPNPFRLPEVNHKDANKGNSDVRNLEWMTHKDNHLHATKLGLHAKKLDEEKVLEIRRRLESGETGVSLGKAFGVRPENIYFIRDRKIWKHI